MTKHRLGWPDLLLVVAFIPALTGHFIWAMSLLWVYALLYHRATRRDQRVYSLRGRVPNADHGHRSRR